MDLADRLSDRNQKVVEEFLRLCNYMSNDADLATAFFDSLSREHRTIQQCALGVLKVVIDKFGHPDRRDATDLRNEHAYRWASDVRRVSQDDMCRVPEMRFPFL